MLHQDDLKKQITEYYRRLQKLKEQQARYGFATEPHILTEIEDIEAELAKLEAELEALPEITRQNPYRGLSAFREEDAELFFGRESFTTQLVDSVRHKPLIAVLGPSGSGKSSIVFAGLLPCLRQEGRWLIAAFRPGQEPFRALAAALLPHLNPALSEVDQLVERRKMSEALSQGGLELAEVAARLVEKNPPAERFLLVADQFEELFTLCPDPDTRRHFLDLLLATFPSSSFRIPHSALVLTLRADFLAQALTYRPLADALREADVKLGPMTPEELRRAIARPAEVQGANFEPGLVERILTDVSDQPGNLPLLEFALTALWEQQRQGQLTHAAYEAIGRVEGALSRHAEQVFAGLSEAEQAQARRVFVQMVRPGEGTEDTRRLARRDELDEADWGLVQQLASARLVVTDQAPNEQETVEVVHEALIRGWDRLSGWMSEDRHFRAWQERLRAALRQWQVSKLDESALLRGISLAEAEGWLLKRPTDLNQTEKRYINAGLQQRRKQEQQRRLISVGAIVFAIIMAGLAIFSFSQAQEITQQKEVAEMERDFPQSATAPSVRLNYLVQLFDRPGYQSRAIKLFWQLSSQEDQLALFKLKDNRLVGVIKELYITLADVNWTGYTDPLLTVMVEALANRKDEEVTNLKAELDQWQQARTLVRRGLYETARTEYDKLIDSNGNNPATHYERAGVLAELDENEAALKDLDQVMELVIDNPSLASTGMIEGSSEFATVDQVIWAVKRLIQIKPELGRALNSASSTYYHLEQRGLVLAPTPTPIIDASGTRMVLVPAGPFQMGSNSGYSDEQPIHPVTLSTFYIDQYEVTNTQFAAFLNEQGNQKERGANWLQTEDDLVRIHQKEGKWQPDDGYANHPVNDVTWYGARAYCQWRQARLPTEAEWEKAARGTDERIYPWGKVITCNIANYYGSENKGCVGSTTPVGAYPTGISPYGAYDMAGNVWEWVVDGYDQEYYSISPTENPIGPQGDGYFKVLHGGAWRYFAFDARSTRRNSIQPNGGFYYTGFRCVTEMP